MALSGSFWGSTAAPQAPAQAAPQPTGGGVGGWLYNNLVKPTVNSVGGAISDVPRIGESVANLGKIGAGVITGNKVATSNAVTAQNKVLDSSNFKNKFEDPNLEKAGGKSTGQVLNLLAPVAGGATSGVKDLAVLGAKLGATGGAANAAAKGEGAGGVANNALGGAAVGGVTGAAGGGLAKGAGALLGKVSGKADTAAINPTDTPKPNIVQAKSAKQGVNDAQNILHERAQPFANVTKSNLDSAGSYDKNGKFVGLNHIQDMLQSMGTKPTPENMQAFHDVMASPSSDPGSPAGWINGALDSSLQGAGKIDVGDPLTAAKTAVQAHTDPLGELGSGGHADSTMAQIRNTIQGKLYGGKGNVGTPVEASDVLQAVRGLESASSHLSPTAETTPAKQAVYKAVIGHLNDALSENSNVNESVNGFKTTPEDQMGIHADVKNSGLSEGVGKHIINTLDNAKTYQDLRSALQPAVIAGNLSKAAQKADASALPEAAKTASNGGMGGLSTTYEGASALHGNPIAAGVLGVKAAKVMGGKAAARLAPDAYRGAFEAKLAPSEVAAGKIAQAGGGGDVPPVSPTAAPVSQPSIIDDHTASNVFDRMMGGVKNAHAARAATAVGAANAEPGLTNGQPPSDQVPGDVATSLPTDTPSSADTATGSQVFTSEVLEALAIRDIQETGGKNLASISTLSSLFGSQGKETGKSALTATQQTRSDAIQNAAGAIQVVAQQFAKAGGANLLTAAESKIPFIDRMKNPSDLNAYNATRYDAASALAAATVGGKPTASSIKYWEGSLPAATDSAEKAQQKIDNIMQQLTERGKIYGLTSADLIPQ